MTSLKAFILILTLGTNCQVDAFGLSYEDARRSFLQAEDLMATGGQVHLTPAEFRANEILMEKKFRELRRGFLDTDHNLAGIHFFKAKAKIERSEVFRILKQMPKGASLHVHNAAAVSSEFLVRNISYMPGLVRCVNRDNVNILAFRRDRKNHGCVTDYVKVSDERYRSISPAEYDRNFEKIFNLYTPSPELEYTSIDIVWRKFQNMFGSVREMVRYVPAYRAIHRKLLEEMYEDNIMYGELRLDCSELYDDQVDAYPCDFTIKQLINIVEEFKRTHPRFLGIKVIYSVHRLVNASDLLPKMINFHNLHTKYPQFFIGFDLVGQEDKGKPLVKFVETLVNLPSTAKYFFHAGETNWYGASTDINLLDAILLNTSRIGHGYALLKHPRLLEVVKERQIGIEVCPISNQVLELVKDLRNHPGAFYISQNVPMVICNDDPGFWGTRGLSYDFFYALMSLAPNNAGLKVLKQLVWNSILYSAMSDGERQLALRNLQQDWNKFIQNILKSYVPP